MKSTILFQISILLVIYGCQQKQQNEQNVLESSKSTLSVEVYEGNQSSVNSYLFSNGKSLMVMDVLRSSEDAIGLQEFIESKGLPLTHILITHGHPDHYMGIEVLSKAFPQAKIIVPSQEIKDDIKGFSTWMEGAGWLDNDPALKPKTQDNPSGFDYDAKIQVYDSDTFTLNGGGTLNIQKNYIPAEAEHLSTVFSKDLNSLFISDFCYNGVHLWLGQGVDANHIINWKDQLAKFKEEYTDPSLVIYPGHGRKSSLELFDLVTKYISDFETTIANSSTKEVALLEMQTLYPDWKQADFLLQYSVDYHFSLKKNK